MYCYSRDGRGDCSDICLPNAMGRSCRCRDDVALELNDRTCTNGNTFKLSRNINALYAFSTLLTF